MFKSLHRGWPLEASLNHLPPNIWGTEFSKELEGSPDSLSIDPWRYLSLFWKTVWQSFKASPSSTTRSIWSPEALEGSLGTPWCLAFAGASPQNH